ncbi:hypothetical protein Tco_0882283 [Tanacetum coccineum]
MQSTITTTSTGKNISIEFTEEVGDDESSNKEKIFTSSKNDNIITSNSYSALNDEEEEVENVYDESANLFTKLVEVLLSRYTMTSQSASQQMVIPHDELLPRDQFLPIKENNFIFCPDIFDLPAKRDMMISPVEEEYMCRYLNSLGYENHFLKPRTQKKANSHIAEKRQKRIQITRGGVENAGGGQREESEKSSPNPSQKIEGGTTSSDGRAWLLSSFLIEHHFTKDDIIFGSTKPDYSTRFAKLMKDNFEMLMIGEMKFFLGLQVLQSPQGIFIYADLAGCNDDCKSTSRGIQFLGDKLVNWSSKKQDCTAMSTAEAEYVSLSAYG